MRERPDAYRAMFNNIYRTDNPVFSTQPNALLVATIEQRKPGRALDIGIGQGRNSVFLALKGWHVTGFDASDEGIATAQRNATRAGVKINAVRETEAAFDYGAGQWDLIVFTYEPFRSPRPRMLSVWAPRSSRAASSSSKALHRTMRPSIARRFQSTRRVYWHSSIHNNFAFCGLRTRWLSQIGTLDKGASRAWLRKSGNETHIVARLRVDLDPLRTFAPRQAEVDTPVPCREGWQGFLQRSGAHRRRRLVD